MLCRDDRVYLRIFRSFISCGLGTGLLPSRSQFPTKVTGMISQFSQTSLSSIICCLVVFSKTTPAFAKHSAPAWLSDFESVENFHRKTPPVRRSQQRRPPGHIRFQRYTLIGDGPTPGGWASQAGDGLSAGRIGTLRRRRITRGYRNAMQKGWNYFINYVSSHLRLPVASLK